MSIARLQDRIASAIGVNEHGRADTVRAMQTNNARRAPGYWIQLFLAMGIATLGLVLDSTAVVIGAMLVSPLMGPIIELGMGFAVGSSLLVIRAFVRVLLSVIVVTLGAALLTVVLPFHEVTSEIAARSAPTALDLLVAIFCALTAAYTTVRPGADSTAAAAGTAIGIALVPPICTIGFGLGTASGAIASGAALLFTANLSAILVVAVLCFLALGYNQVDAAAIEEGFITNEQARADRLAAQVHRLLGGLFGSRYGLAMRLAVPAVVLAAVYVPLRRALDEVTWEVQARAAIRRIVNTESPGSVETSVTVERHTISLRLLIIGSTARAIALDSLLVRRIAAASGVTPTISVVPVADARTLAAATEQPRRDSVVPPASVTDISSRLAAALSAVWPATAGPLAGWQLAISPDSAAAVTVHHLGPPLGSAGLALLSGALSSRLGSAVVATDAPIYAAPIALQRGRVTVWVDSALALLATMAPADSVVACVQSPITTTTSRAADRAILSKLQGSTAGQAGRVMVTNTGPWTIRAALGPCATPPSSGGAPK